MVVSGKWFQLQLFEEGKMITRNFKEWLSTFRPCIADYGYYADFDKITKNIDNLKVELNI